MNFIAKQRAMARELDELRQRIGKLELLLASARAQEPAKKKRGRPPKSVRIVTNETNA